MNWYKKASNFGMDDWEIARKKLEDELGREPTTVEVQRKMFEMNWGESLKGDVYNQPLLV